jgi:hypothetical protein
VNLARSLAAAANLDAHRAGRYQARVSVERVGLASFSRYFSSELQVCLRGKGIREFNR